MIQRYAQVVGVGLLSLGGMCMLGVGTTNPVVDFDHLFVGALLAYAGFALRDEGCACTLLGAALLASSASSVFDLYKKYWWFDEALHCYFSFALTLVLALHAYGTLLTSRRRHEVLLVLTLAGLGLAFGTLWEMVEWAYDLLHPANVILGKRDTMVDLTLDTLGGVGAGIVGVKMLRGGPA